MSKSISLDKSQKRDETMETPLTPRGTHRLNSKRSLGQKFLIAVLLLLLVGGIVVGILFAVKVLPPRDSSTSDSSSSSASASAQAAAVSGTTMQTVSVIDAKGDNTGSGGSPTVMSYGHVDHKFVLELLTPNTFTPTSDYALFPSPSYVVSDKTSQGADFINMIKCIVNQLRIKDVFYNPAVDPQRLPYAALVDMGSCQSNSDDSSSLVTFYVNSNGPLALGDGVYRTTAVFAFPNEGDDKNVSINMHLELTNTVVNGTSQVSKLFFESDGGMMKGGVVLNFTDPYLTQIETQEKQQRGGSRRLDDGASSFKGTAINLRGGNGNHGNGNSGSGGGGGDDNEGGGGGDDNEGGGSGGGGRDASYFKSAFNPITHEGSAVTGFDGDTYEVQFNPVAYRRKQTAAAQNDICVDFRIEKRILSADGYQLFSAVDGSRLSLNTGVVVKKSVTGFPNPLQLFIGYYGSWSMPARDSNGNVVQNTLTYFNDGDAVTKVDYRDPNSNTQFTLKKANARLTKTTKGSVTLGQIKGVILSVNMPLTGATKSIKWDGTKLVIVGDQRYRCGSWNDGSFIAYETPNITNPTPDDCQCLDILNDNGRRRYTGSKNKDSGVISVDYIGDIPKPFIPNADDFPWGMQVRSKSGSMWGNLAIEYESLQTLYLSKAYEFHKGQVIRQGSLQATVYKNTTIFLYGLTCPSSNKDGKCFHYVNYEKDWKSCGHAAPQKGKHGNEWGNWLPKGVKLTQGATVGYTADNCAVNPGQGIPVIMETGVFNLNDPISVEQPYDANLSPNGQAITGNMTWTSVNSIESWPSPQVIEKGNCDLGTQFIINATGVDNAKLYGYGPGKSSKYLKDVWVDRQNRGDNCNQDTLQIHVYPIYGHCSVLPRVTAKCSKRIEALGNTVTVLLSSPDNKIISGSEITTIGNIAVNDTMVWWASNDKGKIFPPTSNTKLVFQTQEVIQPDAANIPTLYCYDQCPNVTSSNFDSCAGEDPPKRGKDSESSTCYKMYPTKLGKFVGNGQAGSCSVKPIYTFTGIGGNPTIDITWSTSKNSTGNGDLYGISSITVTDPGKTCDPSGNNDPTLTFVDSTSSCTSLPSDWKLTCQQGNDVSDFRQANLYSFNALTGLLTDTATGNTVVINTQGNGGKGNGRKSQSYGPFFEPPSAADIKKEILCDYDKTEVCAWKIYQSPSMTYYNYETGSDAYRMSLLSSTNTVLKISKQLDLLYTHQGNTSNSGTDYDGSTFLFSYNGPGQLQGFPYICLDPNTYERVPYCTQTWVSDATVSIPDITINKDIPLTDLTGAVYYYALPSQYSEFYPKASNESLCNGLNLDHLPTVATFNDWYKSPSNANQGLPTSAQLNGYLNGGNPVVIKGQTLAELASASTV